MNKYLKILALSGGLLGAIAPTALNVDNSNNNDISKIYENIEKMQNIIPRLSKINYQLNIDSVQDENVTFISTDDTGEVTELAEDETIHYLNETLAQTNIEYEQLKETLSIAIKDTMDYLDKYNNGEVELTNEQKLYIKEHTNSIKFLAETLENLSEDIICAIDGCEEDDFDSIAGKYISTINDLETRIQALQSSLNSLQYINSIGNPFFYAGYRSAPNRNIYGLQYGNPDNNIQVENESQNNTENESNNIQDDTTNNSQEDGNLDDSNIQEQENLNDNTTEQDTNALEENQVLAVEQDTANTNTEVESNSNNEDKPTTFGLKSNIDTYAPTKRNIDTFFNTALYNNNEYMYGGGNYMPYGYGYGGGYGYGMPYGPGYGNPYGMSGINSNMINREVMNNHYNNQEVNNPNNTDTLTPVANIETETPEEVSKPKKVRAKRAKNIDTYTGTTIQSNVNTMGESKISKFFKEKFNNLRNKVKSQKDKVEDSTQNLPQNLEEATDNIINQEEVITPDTLMDNNAQTENSNNLSVNASTTSENVNNAENSKLNNENDIKIDEEKQVKAK